MSKIDDSLREAATRTLGRSKKKKGAGLLLRVWPVGVKLAEWFAPCDLNFPEVSIMCRLGKGIRSSFILNFWKIMKES